MILKLFPLLIFLPMVLLQNIDPNCDYSQQMVTGQRYFIYNKEYPDLYRPSTCRWSARSAPNTKIIFTCSMIQIPKTNGCRGDKIAVSLTGNDHLTDARTFCGNGTLTLESQSNSLTIGLFTTSNTAGGKFNCEIIAVENPQSFPTDDVDQTCQCGLRDESRIVGGKETGVNEFPMMAGIIRVFQQNNKVDYSYYCGSTIINRKYVLTAGHCVHQYKPQDIVILVGDHNLNSSSDTQYSEIYLVDKIIVHPDFNANILINDIALVRAQDQIQFNIAVSPVCLPVQFQQSSFLNQPVIALGWGTTEFLGERPDVLQEANLKIASCKQQSHPMDISRQICTFNDDQDTCQSDSGGPVMWQESSTRRLYLVGIISYGGDCNSLSPSFNTRVSRYISWIMTQTTDANYCLI